MECKGKRVTTFSWRLALTISKQRKHSLFTRDAELVTVVEIDFLLPRRRNSDTNENIVLRHIQISLQLLWMTSKSAHSTDIESASPR